MPVVLATWEAKVIRIAVRGQPIFKITRAKQTGEVVQVVEYLLCNYQA
jgi:hypothetical protein